MPSCTSPLRLGYANTADAGGARYSGLSRTVACGKCLACRLNHGRDWAVRISHEASLHDANSFLTLTYSDPLLPSDRGLSKREFQLFLKRLRRHCEPRTVRFFGCGEYGEERQRPHYHLILFGEDFRSDRVLKDVLNGNPVYISETLAAIWGLGHCLIGDVTVGSAVYVARYNLKKAASYSAGERYRRVNEITGETWQVEPEFLLMSRRPGIGSGWWDQFASDCFPSDYIVLDGSKMPVPKYYRNKYNGEAQTGGLSLPRSFPLDAKKKARALKHPEERSTARQLVRDEVLHRRAPTARDIPDDI